MQPIPIANPPNPWSSIDVEYLDGEPPTVGLQIFRDASRTILSRNGSPDVGFEWSVNPYRGCMHACAYCYARPTHEYLGFGAGTDFDRKLTVKFDAPDLLRAALTRCDRRGQRKWRGDTIVFSGVTDCYQPIEACYRLTRGCLEVCAAHANPVGIITKSALIERDVDVLERVASQADLRIAVSIPFRDAATARAIEPYAPSPDRRLRTIERLAARGFFVAVNIAPVIPGLNDTDIPAILHAARSAGARGAGFVLLRLPGSVKAVFEQRLRAAFPLRANRILGLVRDTRGGDLYDARFGVRGRGTGATADNIATLFRATAARLGFRHERWADEGVGEATGAP